MTRPVFIHAIVGSDSRDGESEREIVREMRLELTLAFDMDFNYEQLPGRRRRWARGAQRVVHGRWGERGDPSRHTRGSSPFRLDVDVGRGAGG